MISCSISEKPALVSFSKTTNSTRPSDSFYIEHFEKLPVFLLFLSKLNSKSCYYCTYTNVSKFYDAQQRLDKNCTKHTPFPFSIKPIRKQIPLYNSTCAVYFSISWVSKWTLTWIRSIWVFTNSMLMANNGRFDAFIYIYIRYFHNIFTSVKELKSHVIHNYKYYLRQTVANKTVSIGERRIKS